MTPRFSGCSGCPGCSGPHRRAGSPGSHTAGAHDRIVDPDDEPVVTDEGAGLERRDPRSGADVEDARTRCEVGRPDEISARARRIVVVDPLYTSANAVVGAPVVP